METLQALHKRLHQSQRVAALHRYIPGSISGTTMPITDVRELEKSTRGFDC